MKRKLFFFFLICYSALLQAQSPLLETISIEQGLSQGFVPSICQDDDGFLWFATKNGLNRYDGYQFQVFKNDPFDSLSLNDNELTHIQASGDFLILSTNGKGIQLFHRKTQRFYAMPSFAGPNLLHSVFPIEENSVGMLFHEAGEVALYLIHWPSDLVERVEKGATLADLFRIEIPLRRSGLFEADVSADQKKIRLLTQNSILEYDIQSGATSAIDLPFPFAARRNIMNSKRILSDFSGAAWIFQGTKLARLNGRKWDVFTLPFQDSYLICTDKKGGFFGFLAGNTLYGLDLNKKPFNPMPTWELPLEQPIASCFADQFGNIWMGTDAYGIRKFSPRTGTFKNYMKGFSVYCQPVYNGKNHVLMGDVRRRDSFLKLLDLRSGQMVPTARMGLPEQNSANGVTTENGRFWFVVNKKPTQLICLDPETGFLESIPVPVESNTEFFMLRFVPPGEIWMFSKNKMIRFDIAERQFFSFDNRWLSDYSIKAVEHDREGSWWIGTSNGLLHKAKPDENGQSGLRIFKAEKNNRNSLPTNSIKSLLIDPADPNVLWIGTNGHGLTRLEISKNRFTHFTTKNGLPDDVVYGILADDETPRNLWISTNRGLTRFSPETDLFQYYFKSDGLQDNEFNTFASYKSPSSGKLFFGGVNGLTVFDPKDLDMNSELPQVRLTGLKINGRDISPRDSNAIINKDIAFLERLELSFYQNSIVLQFAATDYTSPQRNQFAYYLEGAEQEWAHRGFEHSAQYLNLAPGTYTFRVKAANSSGVWNEEPIALVIVIHAPWYRTWWAYLLYATLLAGAVFMFYKNQLRRRLEHAEAERLKGLDEFKSRFFTNITHEFRTPLTVILGTNEQLTAGSEQWAIDRERPAVKGKLNLIKRNGENLLRLINQILDLAKLESKTLKMNYVQGDVLAYLRYIAESLHSLANAQNVMLRVESDQAKIVMDYDPERLLQIAYNLLSNAIKFTPSGGKVVLRSTVDSLPRAIGDGRWTGAEIRPPSAVHRPPFAVITVTDTGVGISPEALPHIFDRFYQANNLEKANAGGTGIGLALTKELVKAMGGDISVESEVGKGTTFTVRLPITRKAENPAQAGQVLNLPPLESLNPQILKSSTPQILLIEDNADVVEYLAACLSSPFGGGREGAYQLDFAYNGRAGIEKALKNVPDLIVSDVMMPEKDGFEVVETLKNDERSSHIPIVLLTAKADVASRIAGLKRGADAYLAKPFHQEELLVTINNLLELRRKLHTKYASIANAGLQTPDWPGVKSEFRNPQPEIDLENQFLQKIRSIVEHNLSDADFEMPHLERAVAMSRSQIFRKIKALTGKSPSQFIRSIRLQHGRQLLQTTGLTVSEIAYKVGFANVKYFSDAFLEEFGERPTGLRG
ncbi:MAG: ATP-binding protein [Saprospiraceae bacterium]